MIQDIHLYIGGREVEFKTSPDILYNYSLDEVVNPVAVKNSYSKTVTIEGTNTNNDIFGHIWNLERIQAYGGVQSGVQFNPMSKTDFQLFVNGELYEQGYAKLEAVRTKHDYYEYDITLFGGLGDFFHNLSSDVDGNKKTLASLIYATDEYSEPDLTFYANKETVKEAWDSIMDYDRKEKWEIINFAPAYNGVPSGFDADRVLINANGLQNISQYLPTSGQSGDETYYFMQSYAVCEAANDLTEWETFDLRSYHQRPVVSVKKVIDAICNPLNNGGYTVRLDPEFFNSTNSYYWDSWMTLPLIENMELAKESETNIGSATLVKDGYFWEIVPDGTDGFVSYNNVNVKVQFKATFTADTGNLTRTYTSMKYDADTSFSFHPSDIVKTFYQSQAIVVQLEAYDETNQVVSKSNIYKLCTGLAQTDTDWGDLLWGWNYPNQPEEEVITVQGDFRKIMGEWIWCDTAGNPQGLNFRLLTSKPYARVGLRIMTPYRRETKYRSGSGSVANSGPAFLYLWDRASWQYKGNQEYEDIASHQYLARLGIEVQGISLTAYDYEDFLTNTKVDKKTLLSTPFSPCEFLLSFAKQFNLHFVKDVDTKTIHILDRSTYYNGGLANLEDLIDRSKDFRITPTVADHKWYDFGLEQIDSVSNAINKKNTGLDYGMQRVNTGFEFDTETKDMFESSVFKGAIQVLEKDSYFRKPINGQYPLYLFNGSKIKLFQLAGQISSNSFNITGRDDDTDALNPQNLKDYDAFDKVQFHEDGNDGSEGYVLLFFNGKKETDVNYWITDDTQQMLKFNGNKPCWLLTASETDASGQRIAIQTNELPYFTRQLVGGGNVIASWDFSVPRTTFVPDVYPTDEQGIYYRYWKSYITDLLSVDTRKLECYVRLMEKPSPTWLRRFYWFDNTIWRLEKIIDWNAAKNDTTKMVFVKVQDMKNYLDHLHSTTEAAFRIVLEKYTIGSEGGDIKGYIYVQDGGAWSWSDWGTINYPNGELDYFSTWGDGDSIIDPYRGTGTTEFVIHVPANTTGMDRDFTFGLPDYISPDERVFATFKQIGESGDFDVQPRRLEFDWSNNVPKRFTYTGVETVEINPIDK